MASGFGPSVCIYLSIGLCIHQSMLLLETQKVLDGTALVASTAKHYHADDGHGNSTGVSPIASEIIP